MKSAFVSRYDRARGYHRTLVAASSVADSLQIGEFPPDSWMDHQGPLDTIRNQRNVMQEQDNQHGYDLWAPFYDETDNPMVATAKVALSEKLGSRNFANQSVLELGCGTGRNYRFFAERGCTSWIGLDFSHGMLEMAQACYSQANFVLHDIREPLPISSSSVDIVLVSLVLEHIQELGALYQEVARVVRPGGQIWILEMHPYLALQGTGAHFIQDGKEIRLTTVAHNISDLLGAGLHSGLVLLDVEEFPAQHPKARAKWQQAPYLLTIGWRRVPQ